MFVNKKYIVKVQLEQTRYDLVWYMDSIRAQEEINVTAETWKGSNKGKKDKS